MTTAMMPAPAPAAVRACRVCGCTQEHACVDPEHGPCWWVEEDLCSHCGEPRIVLAAFDQLAGHVGENGALTPEGLVQLIGWANRARAALEHVDRIECDLFDL